MDWLISLFHALTDWLRSTHPAVLLAAMVLLPLFGVPASPLVILGGIRFGLLGGTLAAFNTVALNCVIGYWVAAHWFKGAIERWLARRGRRLPVLPAEEEWKFILLFRLTPGIPLFVQNYVLGCARVRFGLYLLLSIPIQWAFAFGFVVFGNSLAGNSVGRVVMACCLLVAVALLVNLLRQWSKKRYQATDALVAGAVNK